MHNRGQLLLRHVWGKDEGFHVESVEEELNTVRLDQVVCVNDKLALHKTQLFEQK